MTPLPLFFLLAILSTVAENGPASKQGAPAPAPAAAAPMTDAEAMAIAKSVTPSVEEIRGLKFLRPVPVRIVSDAVARGHFEARLAKFWPEDQMLREQTVYRQLGLLPADGDLQAGLFSLLEEQAGGYYDPESDTFYVLDDMPRSIAPMLMAHELTHALDDQHFDLDRLFTRTKDDFDRSGVVSAVVEGSGTLVMSIFLVRELQSGRMSPSALTELAESEAGRGARLEAAPAILKRGLLAPYLVGMGFVLRGDLSRLAAGVSPADLNRALTEPPESSEQILHPEKYWDPARAEAPGRLPSVDLSAPLGKGWRLEGEGTLGELTLAILAGAPDVDMKRADAADAALWTNQAVAGWGADRWQLYAHGDRRVTVLLTRWDTEADAAEFEAAVAARQPARRGRSVVIVSGDAGERAGEISAAALDSLEPAKGQPAAG